MTTRIIPALSVLYVLLIVACNSNGAKAPATTKPATADSLTGKPLPASVIDSTSSTFIDTSLDRFAFIAEEQYIILSASPDSNWAKGEPYQATETNGTYSSITDVNTAALPASYKELLNKKYKIGCSTGALYTATITDFKLLATVIPHFGQVQDWNQLPATEADKIKARDIRRDGALYLVATFTSDKATTDTGNLYFAVPAAQPTPAVFTFADKNVAATYKTSITPLLAKTKNYLSIQKKYEAAAQKGIWWQDKEGYESIESFSLNDQKTYVTICHQDGNACSADEFFAERFSIWEVSKNAAPSLLYLKDGYYNVLLAVDIDADNIPELLVDSGFGKTELLKFSNGQWTEYYTWIVPYHDCPC